jgi:hypothetical protein
MNCAAELLAGIRGDLHAHRVVPSEDGPRNATLRKVAYSLLEVHFGLVRLDLLDTIYLRLDRLPFFV